MSAQSYKYMWSVINRNILFNLEKNYRVSVGITVDAPVTAVSNKTNDIQCFKDI